MHMYFYVYMHVCIYLFCHTSVHVRKLRRGFSTSVLFIIAINNDLLYVSGLYMSDQVGMKKVFDHELITKQ